MHAETLITPALADRASGSSPPDWNSEARLPVAQPAQGRETNVSPKNNRILVADDNPAIHEDFKKVLGSAHEPQTDLAGAEASLFGDTVAETVAVEFEIDSAYQGQEALAKVQQAQAAGRPYAMAFIDVR